MLKYISVLLLLFVFGHIFGQGSLAEAGLDTFKGMNLVWQDEFNQPGPPDPTIWRHEQGFKRNNELQWYQPENASCHDGILIIEAKRVVRPNPTFVEDSKDWQTSRRDISFTSSSIQTRGAQAWLYGTFVVRARIDTLVGSWPAIWTLGTEGRWPSNGEIDIMEFYRVKTVPTILANIAWGTEKVNVAKWDDAKIPLTHFTDKYPNWVNQYHIWRMDWDENQVSVYLDDELINEITLNKSINPDGTNPFKQPHYLLLNLAIGGNNGGAPGIETHSIKFEVDYVRVYQKK